MTWPFEDKILDIKSALQSASEECNDLLIDLHTGMIPDCIPKEVALDLQGALLEVLDLIKKSRAEAIEAAEWLNPKPDDLDPGPSQEQRQ